MPEQHNIPINDNASNTTQRNPLKIVEVDATPRKEAWYAAGLRFQCTGCGKCCTGFPGAVWVSDEELVRIAEYLNEPIEAVKERYTRLIGENERCSLKEVGKDYDCVFLIEKKLCRIYEVRPKQCKTYPWWPSVLESKKAWEEAKATCEGIDHTDAPLIEGRVIDALLKGEGG